MKEQLKSLIYLGNRKIMKVSTFIMLLSLMVFFSCQDENIDEIENLSEITIENEESGIGNPIDLGSGCNASIRFIDLGVGGSLSGVPFYSNTVINDVARVNGRCVNPPGPTACAFQGSVTIYNNTSLSGEYRVITPLGTTLPVGTITNSFTYIYGSSESPLGITCGQSRSAFIQAFDTTIQDWVVVAAVGFICTRCNFNQVPM